MTLSESTAEAERLIHRCLDYFTTHAGEKPHTVLELIEALRPILAEPACRDPYKIWWCAFCMRGFERPEGDTDERCPFCNSKLDPWTMCSDSVS